MTITGAHHIALTVTDLDASVAWYEALLDLDVVLHEPGDERQAIVWRLRGTDLFFGLVQHAGTKPGFDPTVVGLDHFAFRVAARADLDTWIQRLDDLGIDHSPAIDVPPGAIVNFKDPDGIALSLFWDRPA